MILVFNKFGSVLSGRDHAQNFREQIQDSTAQKITLDFSDIRTISHSFADELLGKLAVEMGSESFKNRFEIINLSDKNRNMIKFVLSERMVSESKKHAS